MNYKTKEFRKEKQQHTGSKKNLVSNKRQSNKINQVAIIEINQLDRRTKGPKSHQINNCRKEVYLQ